MPITRPAFARQGLAARARTVLIAGLGLVAAATAGASDFSLGVSAGGSHGRTDCLDGYPCDHGSGSWKLSGTYRVADAVDLQASYFHAGSFEGADLTPLGTPFSGRFRVQGLGLTAGYRWAVAQGWGVGLRAGAASVRTRFAYDAPFSGHPGKTTLQPLAGLSVDYALTPAVRIGLDYDLTRFKAHETRGPLQLFGVALQYAF